MRFPGKQNLNRMVGICQQGDHPFEMPENERCPLVGCETSRESDCQCIRRQYVRQRQRARISLTTDLIVQARAREFNKISSHPIAKCPEFLIAGKFAALDPFPESLVHQFLCPIITKPFVPKLMGVTGSPARSMNPIGNVADRDVIHFFAGVQLFPHFAADTSV